MRHQLGSSIGAALAAGVLVQWAASSLPDGAAAVLIAVVVVAAAAYAATGFIRSARSASGRTRATGLAGTAASGMLGLLLVLQCMTSVSGPGSVPQWAQVTCALGLVTMMVLQLGLLTHSDCTGLARITRMLDVAAGSAAVFALVWQFAVLPMTGTLPGGASTVVWLLESTSIFGASWALVSIISVAPGRNGYACHLLGTVFALYAISGLLGRSGSSHSVSLYAGGSNAAMVTGALLMVLVSREITRPVDRAHGRSFSIVWMLLPYVPMSLTFIAVAALSVRSGGANTMMVCVLLGTTALAMIRQFLSLLVIRDQARQLDRQRDLLNRQAHHDSLTGLYNRAACHQLADRILAAARPQDLTAVLLIDLDGFKPVNDTLGHAAGDAVLIEVGNRITEAIRPDDVAARIGGDEFVVLLPRLTDASQAEAVALRILHEMAEPIEIDGVAVRVSASIGISHATGGGAELKTLLREADKALYSAKAAGKNMYQHFLPEPTRQSVPAEAAVSHSSGVDHEPGSKSRPRLERPVQRRPLRAVAGDFR